MSSSPDLTPEILRAAFTEQQMRIVPEQYLEAVADPDARETLRTLGVPDFRNPWFSGDSHLTDGFTRVGEFLDWNLTDAYDEVPEGAEQWIRLGMVPYDEIALDPVSGQVFCLPQDGEIQVLNTRLRHYVHFLYLLKVERPNYDPEWEDPEAGDDTGEADEERPLDGEGARLRIETAMRAIDPAALQEPESLWLSVLENVEDPSSQYY